MQIQKYENLFFDFYNTFPVLFLQYYCNEIQDSQLHDRYMFQWAVQVSYILYIVNHSQHTVYKRNDHNWCILLHLLAHFHYTKKVKKIITYLFIHFKKC